MDDPKKRKAPRGEHGASHKGIFSGEKIERQNRTPARPSQAQIKRATDAFAPLHHGRRPVRTWDGES